MEKIKTLKIILILIALEIVCTACGKSVEERIAEQLELGNRYLEEMDYEQAIVAFNKAIEIDARQVQAYIGGAEAYAAMTNYEDAVSLLESGTENIQDAALVEKMGEVCQNAAQYYMEAFINRGLAMDSFKYLEKLDQEIHAIPFLVCVEELLKREDYEQTVEQIQKQELLDLITSLGESELYYYGEYDESGERNGKGIAIYPVCGEGSSLRIICYYGTWKNEKRSGYGVAMVIWPDSTKRPYGMYEGQWANDLPNGHGEEYYEIVVEELEKNSGMDFKRSGSYENGLFNGEMYMEVIWADGSIESYHGTTQNGVWQYDDDKHDVSGYVKDNKNQGVFWLLPDSN